MRKVLIAGLSIVFCIAIVIGAGIILSIRNVNVAYIDYSGLYETEFSDSKEKLGKLKGSGLLFVKEDDVRGKISDSEKIAVASIEKKFPCTLEITLKERVETFAVKSSGVYSLYDADGKLIKTVEDAGSVPQNVHGYPDIELSVKFSDQIKDVAKLTSYFDKYFKENVGTAIRLIKKIEIYAGNEIVVFSLRSGLNITLNNWKSKGEAKVKKAYETYRQLPDEKRISGMFMVKDGENGSEPIVVWS